ncbi:MAG TPA: hypothetical protein VM582_09925, partial [Candidatus Thermoplasmatota archaeon]|nr:hypothetical protein [Candidatus Thermoplasmatota archaeon]
LERAPADLPDLAGAFAAFDALAALPPAPEPTPVVVAPAPALAAARPEPEPVHVEAAELAQMPWNLRDDQHEMLPAGRTTRLAPARPTLVDNLAPRAPRPGAMAHDWGLPWPRPVAQTGGLAIADPKVWHAQERIHSVREDLDRIGAPSFGAVKPEGSAWLKRLTEFGGP